MAEEITQERRQELDDFATVMSGRGGRAFITRLLVDHCRVFGSVLVQPHPAVPMREAMSYNAGRQELGQWLLDEISKVDSSGTLFTNALQEARNRHVLKLEREKGKDHAHRDRDPRRNLDEDRAEDE